MGTWGQRLRSIDTTQGLAIILMTVALSILGVKHYSNSAYEAYERFLSAVDERNIPAAIVLGRESVRKASRVSHASRTDFVRLQLGVAEGYMILGAAGPASELYQSALANLSETEPIAPQFPAFDTRDIFRIHLGLIDATLRERTPELCIAHVYRALKYSERHTDALSGTPDAERLDRLVEELSTQIGDVDTLTSGQVEQLLSLSRALESRGQTGPSARLQEAAVKSLDGAITNPALIAELSVRVAEYYLDIEKPGKAEDYINRVFRILSSQHGSKAPEMLPYTALQGRFLVQMDDPKAAIEILEDALETVELFGDPDMPGSVGVVTALESAYTASGEDRELKKLQRDFGWMVDMERFEEAEDSESTLSEVPELVDGQEVDDPYWLEFKVLYGTSRKRADTASSAKYYSSRTAGRAGERGWVKVVLPLEPSAPGFGAPGGGDAKEQTARFIHLRDMDEQSKEDFLFDLNTRVLTSSHSETFVYVHGYGISFDDAARQTARLAHELNFDGVPVFYSWPAQATKFGYLADADPDPHALADFRLFVNEIIDHSGAEKIHFIAHGLGANILLAVLDELAIVNESRTQWSVDEILLSAPDVPRADFGDVIRRVGQISQRITLYASSNDSALQLSQILKPKPRAGSTTYTPPSVKGADSIDASILADTDFLPTAEGAGIYSILTDMKALIWHDLEPEKRCMLRSRSDDENSLYVYDVTQCDVEAFDIASQLVYQQGFTRANETINARINTLNDRIEVAGTEARRRQIAQQKDRYLEAGRLVNEVFRTRPSAQPVLVEEMDPPESEEGEDTEETGLDDSEPSENLAGDEETEPSALPDMSLVPESAGPDAELN